MNGLTFTLCLSASYAYTYQEPTFEEVVVLYSEYPEEEGTYSGYSLVHSDYALAYYLLVY